MADLHTYDPLQIVVIFRGIQISGYADGTFVKVERSEDTWSDQVGADGEMTRVRSRNRSGLITVTLVAGSPTNQLLAAVQQEDENFSTGVGSVMVKDLNGLDLHTGESAWLVKPPDAEYKKEAGEREWRIRVKDLKSNSGGSVL
jgi:hypothetical protein